MTRKDVGCRELGRAREAETDGRAGSWGSATSKCKAGTSRRHASHALLPDTEESGFHVLSISHTSQSCRRPTHAFHWTRMDQPANQAGPLGAALSRQNGPKAAIKTSHGPWLPESRLSMWGVSLVTVALGSTTAPRAWKRLRRPSLSAHIDKPPPRSMVRVGLGQRRHARRPCCQTRAGLACESGPSSTTPL